MTRRGSALTFVMVLGLIALIGYGLFEARRLLLGPQLAIVSPIDGSATTSPLVHIAGVAQNIAFLTINDRPAFTDEEGRFEELLTPPLGYTVLTVAATDRFGRSASKTVSITILNYCPAPSYG